MASIAWALLLVLPLLVQLHPLAAYGVLPDGNLTHHYTPSLCRPDQANTLLKLKQSFDFLDSITSLSSWQAGTDCCLWEGVGCNISSGHIISLDLSGFGLSSYGIDPVLFNLTSLRVLDLSMNYFRGSNYGGIPSGFERLSLLTYLNLSYSDIANVDFGVPVGISKLTNLVTLDLSDNSAPFIPNFYTLVANFSNLKELYLEGAIISSAAEDCFKALAKYVPHLRVLSLVFCNLQGHIDSSLSRLQSLVEINLSEIFGITGPFPEFFMDFLNLRVLQLSGINLEGWFPRGMFRSKVLRVLDLSSNPNLSGYLPNFSNATSLETLRIDRTNLSYVNSSYFSHFKSLAELGLDGTTISMDSISSFGMLVSLRELFLARLDSPRELETVWSWFELEGIKNLGSLHFDSCNFSTTILSSIGKLKNLRSLNFISCDLSMTTSFSIGNLKNLTTLAISESEVRRQILSAFANIRNLKTLTINSLLGQLPSAIGNMTNLEQLGIWVLSGPIPHEIGALQKLRSLELGGGFSGRIPSSIGNLPQLTELRLGGNYLSGRIPSTIANLTRLTELQLKGNHLSGEIPMSIFTLQELNYLDLSENQLSGPIHEFSGVSSRFERVYLQRNELTGMIPQSLMVLPNLRELNIEGNNLMGSVNLASLWRLENLTSLVLSHNKLTVTVSEGSSNSSSIYPSRLVELRLANCNMTMVPNLLIRVNHLEDLDLSNNKIRGDIPNWIWDRWNYDLLFLNLSHNWFTGMGLSSYVIPFSNILHIDVSSNKLQGHIPMPPSAEYLDFSNNVFSSLVPNFTLYLTDTTFVRLSNNNITGQLPHSICNTVVEVLDLSYNYFSGLIPPCLMENWSLRVMNFKENQFEGMLPSNISSECSVETINLNGNKIEGQLPRALYKCSNLEVLDLGRNNITDTFPSWLGRLLNLHVLILRSNQFHGSIGGYLIEEKSGQHFSSLQIIDLASNNFSGNLHPKWFENFKSMKKYNNTGKIIDHQYLSEGFLYEDSVTISNKGVSMTFERILTTLTSVDLSDNALEGRVPTSIGYLASLHVLNMSHNAFTGEIPPQLGSMTALESLDLSSNMLSGEIPQELTNLTFLSILNLSNNQLDGRIPQSRQFETFLESSFGGNAGLCGPPLSRKCGTLDIPSEAHMKSVDVVLFLFVGVGFGVGFAAAILLKLDYWISRWFHIFRIL